MIRNQSSAAGRAIKLKPSKPFFATSLCIASFPIMSIPRFIWCTLWIAIGWVGSPRLMAQRQVVDLFAARLALVAGRSRKLEG